MSDDRRRLQEELEEHRAAIAAIEGRLRALEPSRRPAWPPAGFYLTYYVVAGMLIGILGSLASFLVNIGGSLVVNQDPLRILRVYGTVFLGARALTTSDLNFFMLVAVVHFSVGAVAGAVFHVGVNKFVPDRPLLQIILGGAYGLCMWLVNFHLILVWLQPRLVGEPYVLELMPTWIAVLTHLVYGVTLGVLQPLGRFEPYRPVVAA